MRCATERASAIASSVQHARSVVQRMGFPHFVVEAEDVFRARVLQPFLDAYAEGRTPYPCAACNQHLKFGDLVTRMDETGAELLATGHYARIGRAADGAPSLRRAVDLSKDQSYALSLIPFAVLSRVRFPLGELRKSEVRGHGRRLGLPLWDKPESMDLCFVPDGDYAGYATRVLGETRGTQSGPIEDERGRVIGEHRGILHYTVGQRKGLGVTAGEPLFVLSIDAARNALRVGPRGSLGSRGLVTGAVNWLQSAPPAPGARALVKVRSAHAGAWACVEPLADGAVRVHFDEPQDAITPGQLCVMYDGDRVMGGGAIARAIESGDSNRALLEAAEAARS